jgi:nucleotide-binding universal stress UspA family protein
MPSLQSILVHVDTLPRSRARLQAARQLAQAHGATVTALLADAPGLNDTPYSYSASAAQALQDAELERRQRARAMFEAVFGDEPGATWAELQSQPPVWGVAHQACCADLMLLGQPDAQGAGAAGLPHDFVPAVLAASGRPALVLPHTGHFEHPARTAVVAWTHTPESARALTGALPLLRQAREVHVVSWGETPAAHPGALDIGAYLARHGVQARVQCHPKAPRNVCTGLLNLCAGTDAGLLVMGCYGHSKARQLLLGGVSRAMLQGMTLPVLMAH